MSSLECFVCVEKYSKSNKIKTCPYCEYSCCNNCLETYLLGVSLIECMSCKKLWGKEVRNSVLKKSFIKELQAHREEVLFSLEQSLFSKTMEEEETTILRKQMMNQNYKYFSELKSKRSTLLSEIELLKAKKEELNRKSAGTYLPDDTIRWRFELKLANETLLPPKKYNDFWEYIKSQGYEIHVEKNQYKSTEQCVFIYNEREVYFAGNFSKGNFCNCIIYGYDICPPLMLPTEKTSLIDQYFYVVDLLAGKEKKRLEINTVLSSFQSKMKFLDRVKNPVNSTERKKFIKPCVRNSCTGMLSSQYICSLCKCKVCSHCHELEREAEIDEGADEHKDEQNEEKNEKNEHKCDPNNVATVEALKKDSRKCPNCSVSIHKIEGCDQIWCVKCHTAFSYSTGAIELGRIHNPHYYEYKRKHGTLPREVGDEICGGIPHMNEWIRQFPRRKEYGDVSEFERCLVDIRENNNIQKRVDKLEKNKNLRISYLAGTLSKEEFKKTLIKVENDDEKRIDFCMIMDTLVDAGGDLLRTLTQKKGTLEDIQEFRKQVKELVSYVIESYEKAKRVHNTKVRVPELLLSLSELYKV